MQAKRALVTGADGFIGSHLVEKLLKSGYEAVAFCQYNSFGSYGWLDSIEGRPSIECQKLLGDIRDYCSVFDAMKDVDIVFHLAALIAIPYSYKAPQSYVDTNINGTLNIVMAARDLDIERVVVTYIRGLWNSKVCTN